MGISGVDGDNQSINMWGVLELKHWQQRNLVKMDRTGDIGFSKGLGKQSRDSYHLGGQDQGFYKRSTRKGMASKSLAMVRIQIDVNIDCWCHLLDSQSWCRDYVEDGIYLIMMVDDQLNFFLFFLSTFPFLFRFFSFSMIFFSFLTFF